MRGFVDQKQNEWEFFAAWEGSPDERRLREVRAEVLVPGMKSPIAVTWQPGEGPWVRRWAVVAEYATALMEVDWGWLEGQLQGFAKVETAKEQAKQEERRKAKEARRAEEEAERQAQMQENARENERRELAYQAELAEAEAKEAARIVRIVRLVLDGLGVES